MPFAYHPIASANPQLLAHARAYLSNGLAASTQQPYRSAQRAYLQFCYVYHVSPVPASEAVLCLWVTQLASRNIQSQSISIYLYGVRSLHIEHGLADPTTGLQLQRLLQGIRRTQGSDSDASTRKKKRFAVTMDIVRRLQSAIETTDDYDQCMIMTAIATAVAALLRVGEVAHNESESHRLLRMCDFSWASPSDRTSFYLTLRFSKTDPFSHGVRVVASSPVAVTAMHRYLKARRQAGLSSLPTDPLFMFRNGKALRRRALLTTTRTWLQQHADIVLEGHYRGVSFRRGGATSLSSAGIHVDTIKRLGRWKSHAYKLYIDQGDRDKALVKDAQAAASM